MRKIRRTAKWLILLFLLGLSPLLVLGCAGGENNSARVSVNEPGKICAAVSIVPQADFVQAVGGELVDVVTMIPPGANPENYSPTPQIIEQLSQAELYFAIGVPAEQNGVLSRLEQINPDMKLVDLPGQVDKIYPALELAPGQKDPHRWMSPKRVKEMVKIIARELAAIDPQNAAVYERNSLAYQAELDKLDQMIQSSLEQAAGRSFVIYHPAMGYFASDYNLKMIALEEEGKEARPARLQEVIDQAKKEKIKAIFYQAEMDSKQAETLAQELGGKAELVAPLAPNYIENMSKTARTFAEVLQTP